MEGLTRHIGNFSRFLETVSFSHGDRAEEKSGAALEGLVAQHLRAWIDYFYPGSQLFYWRTSAGSGIDFVLYGKDIFWAVEVKNSVSIHPQDLRALKTFKDDYPEANRFFIYRGKEKLIRDGISIEPVTEFLSRLSESKRAI